MSLARLASLIVLLASVHRQPGWVIGLAVIAWAGAVWLRAKLWAWHTETS
jgi:hypothetical protein